MYKIRNKVYAEAGNLLVGANKLGYVFEGDESEFTDQPIVIDDMKVEGNFLLYSNGLIIERRPENPTYESLKANIIKRLFSNDDQIAIILNKGKSDDDDMIFDKMQEWRDWAGILAKKTLSVLEEYNLNKE